MTPAGRDETPVFLLSCEVMVREISAGGVVLRNNDGSWWMAAIELPSAGDAEGSSMAAIHQLPSLFRRTTPPAEISRTITSQLSRNTGVSSRPAGVIVTITVPLGLPNVMLSSTLVLLQPSIELWHLTC